MVYISIFYIFIMIVTICSIIWLMQSLCVLSIRRSHFDHFVTKPFYNTFPDMFRQLSVRSLDTCTVAFYELIWPIPMVTWGWTARIVLLKCLKCFNFSTLWALIGWRCYTPDDRLNGCGPRSLGKRRLWNNVKISNV